MPLLLHSCHNVTRKQFDEGVTYLQLMKQNVENLRYGLEPIVKGVKYVTINSMPACGLRIR